MRIFDIIRKFPPPPPPPPPPPSPPVQRQPYVTPVSTTHTTETPTEIADEIHADLSKGKSIDTIAEERGMTREAVMNALGGEVTESENGDTRVTTITDDQGRSVTENIDYQHGTHYTVTTTADGETETSPIRTESEKKQEIHYDSETGVTTTTETDDLGDGETRTETSYENGTRVETTVNPDGTTQTFVTGPDGERVELDPTQSAPGLPGENGTAETGNQNVTDTKSAFENGKTIEEIAQERGLSADQVRAELQAAGIDIEETTNGTTTTITLTDSKTGDETIYTEEVHDNSLPEGVQGPVAPSYTVMTVETKDGETDATTKTVTNSQTNTTTRTETDANGRVTETTTQTSSDGTESTTTKVTANGYTMTTAPDGKITLKNNETGDTIEVDKNSQEAVLAQSLVDANPNSKEGEVTTAFAESQLAPKFLEIQEQDATDATEAKNDAIDEHGIVNPSDPNGPKLPGIAAIPTERDGAQDSIGDPPRYGIPPGEQWVPVNINGQWTWVHPDVYAAIQNENIALSQVTETNAMIGSDYTDLNRYLLDPDYQQAVEAAKNGINEKLEPLGLQWNPNKPDGTLEDAKQLQTDANNAYIKAGEARAAYEEGKALFDQALEKRVNMPYYPGRNDTVVTAADSDYNFQEEVAKGEAAWGEINDLMAQVDVQNKTGDQALADMIALTTGSDAPPPGTLDETQKPVEIKIGDQTIKVTPEVAAAFNNEGGNHDKVGIEALAASDAPMAVPVEIKRADGTVKTEWRWVDPQIALFKTQTDGALQFSEAYSNYYTQKSAAADYQLLENQTIAQQRELAPHQFNPDGFTDAGGKFSGEFESAEVIQNKDGQFVLKITYENKTLEIDVTADPDDPSASDTARNGPLAQQWRELAGNTGSNDTQCFANPNPLVGYEQAKHEICLLQKGNIESSITDLDKHIQGMETELQEAAGENGVVTTEQPSGTIPDGQQPVTVELDTGQQVKVAPELAQQLEGLSGAEQLAALTNSSKPVWIKISLKEGEPKQGRWVAPHIADLQIRLDTLNDQRSQLQTAERLINGDIALAERNMKEPELLGTRGSDREYLDRHEQETLDGVYQNKFQDLLNNGFGEEFSGSDLDEYVGNYVGDRSDATGTRATIAEEIRNVSGENPKVSAVPVFYVPENGETSQTTLFAVQNGNNTKYVDANGQSFDNLKDFQDNNRMFADSGKLIIPENLDIQKGQDGRIALEVVDANIMSTGEKMLQGVDIGVGILGAIATVGSFIPGVNVVAAPVMLASGAYLGTRAGFDQADYINHGGEWGDKQSLMNLASIGTAVLPVAGSSMRTLGMTLRTDMSLGRSAQANFGMMNMRNATLSFRGKTWTINASPYATTAQSYMGGAAGLNRVAYALDGSAMALGVPMIAVTTHDIMRYGDQMSGFELANAIAGLGSGVIGTGFGAQAIRNYRPGSFNHSNDGTSDAGAANNTPVKPDTAVAPGRGDKSASETATTVTNAALLPQSAGTTSSRTRQTIQLIDETGHPVEATVLGNTGRPLTSDDIGNIYVPPKGGRQLRGDEPQFANTSHIVVWDGNEAFVLPWVRGAAPNHQPIPNSGPSRAQLQAIGPGEINTQQLEPRHVPWLKRDQVAGLTSKQWTELQQAGLQPYLTRGQLRAVPETSVRYIDAGILTQRQVEGLKANQTAVFTVKQWQAFNQAGSQAHLNKAQLGSIPGSRFGLLDVGGLTDRQVPWLSAKTQLPNMTNTQWKAFNRAGLPEHLTETQFRAIPENRIKGLNVLALKPGQIRWFTQKQWEALNRAGSQKNLNEAQTGTIPVNRMSSLNVSGLEAKHMGWLSGNQLGSLGKRQVQTLSGEQIRAIPEDSVGEITPKFKNEQFHELTLAQMEAVTNVQKTNIGEDKSTLLDELIAARKLTGDDIASMSAPSWRNFTKPQWRELTGVQLRAIPDKRIKLIDLNALRPEQLAEFTPTQASKFTPSQMRSLNKEQLAAFTSSQNAAFRPVQTALITPDRQTSFDGFKPASMLTRAVANMRGIEGLGDYTVTAAATGAMTAVWPVLPPTVQAGIVIGSYGARSITQLAVIAPKSWRPWMEASHPIGRTMRAVTALSYAPSQAYGFWGFGGAPVNSGPFLFGNGLYQAKNFREARTGTSAFPWADKYALAAYGVGSPIGIGEVMMGNASPYRLLDIGINSGFAFGSSWLWMKQNPKIKWGTHTDPSLKNGWGADMTTTDRWIYAITFGGGLAALSGKAIAKALSNDSQEQGPPVPGTDEPATPEQKPEKPEPKPEQPPQLVVIAPDGLNVRETPGMDGEQFGTLRPGSLIDETGERKNDEGGHEWVEINGFGTDGQQKTGWVSAEYIDAHPAGDQDSQGRFNPELESQGYAVVVVDANDNIVVIAKTNNRDVAETVALNLGHINDPSLIFKGDRIYLPLQAVG